MECCAVTFDNELPSLGLDQNVGAIDADGRLGRNVGRNLEVLQPGLDSINQKLLDRAFGPLRNPSPYPWRSAIANLVPTAMECLTDIPSAADAMASGFRSALAARFAEGIGHHRALTL